jgi:hypothetical protein
VAHHLSDNFDALVLALELAITAPTKQKSAELSDIADELAGFLQVSEVELAKQVAISNLFGGYE